MYSRLIKPPTKTSFFLFGPRGVGKTTWVRTKFPKALYIDLLKAETFTYLLANPSRIEEFIPSDFSNWIIIDEIQKVPSLLDEIHRLIEEKHYQFILTGSSARKLRRGGFNLLAGRALTYNLYPLTAYELGDDFKIEEYLKFGGLPGVFFAEDKKAFLKSYLKTYIEQEIIFEAVTRNLGAFSRFLEIASFSQGSVLNMSEVAREAGLGRRMVENYFSALEDLLIGIRIPPFTKKAKRKLMFHPKFYFFDAGVYQAIRPKGPFDQEEYIGGIALETAFFQNLKALIDYLSLDYQIYYYRTVSGVEVDFVIYGKSGFKIFEIKNKREINSSDLKGLKSFINDYPQAKGYLIYGGKNKRYFPQIEVWPAEAAFRELGIMLR